MDNTYRVTLRNPAANPSEFEEEFVTADSQADAELAAADLIARHPFNDIQLISVELVEPGNFYETGTSF